MKHECDVSVESVFCIITTNGKKNFVSICDVCGKRLHIPHGDLLAMGVDVESVDVAEDRSGLCICSVSGCENDGAELHHFAPRHLFGNDANNWAMGYLCKEHHAEWHERTRTGSFYADGNKVPKKETPPNPPGRPPSAYPYMVHVKMPFKDKAEHQRYLAMTKNNTRSRVTAVLGENKNV